MLSEAETTALERGAKAVPGTWPSGQMPHQVVGFGHGPSPRGEPSVLDEQEGIYNAAYRILGDPALAAEVTQQVLRAAARVPARRRRGCRREWFARLLVGECQARQGGQLSASRRRFESPLRAPGSLSLAWRGGAAGGQAAGPSAEPVALIQTGLSELPFDLRVAVVLSDVVGLNYQEIAQATEVSVKTVRTRLSRGRLGLRETLFAHFGFPPEPSPDSGCAPCGQEMAATLLNGCEATPRP